MSTAYAINQDRWAKLSIFDQMGNIYSEVGRSFNAKRRHDVDGCNQATTRAIDLFDTTISVLAAKKSPKSKEVLRSKEQYLSVIYDANASQEKIKSLDSYFRQFAIAARLNR